MITVTFIYPGAFVQTREYSPQSMKLHWIKLNGSRPEVAYIDRSYTAIAPLEKEWLQTFLFKTISKSLHPTRGKMVMSNEVHKVVYG